MQTTPKILIVGSDRSLPNEVDEALASLGVSAVTHHVTDFRQGIESARSRRPDLALVEMGQDQRYLKMFVEEVAVGSPETSVVAVYHTSAIGENASESDIIIGAIRLGVQDFLRRPISSADLGQFLSRMDTRSGVGRPSRAGTVSTFFSNKGGVGKSTLSVNTGCVLAKRYPGRVLLVDASLQLGVCASMLNVTPHATLIDAVRERDRLDETLIRELSIPHPSGLHLLAAPADAVEATLVDDEIISRVLTLARRSFDYVVVDTFPMLDSVMMAILDLTDTAFLVTESVVPTLLGAAKLLNTLDKIGVASARRRVVLNRYSDFAGNLKPADVARRLGQDVDHVIPYQKKLLVAANLGEPLILSQGKMAKFNQRVYRLVDDIVSAAPASSRPAQARESAPVIATNQGDEA